MRFLLIGSTGLLGSELLSQWGCWENEAETMPFERPLECITLGRQEMDLTQADRVYDTVCRLRPHIIINAAGYTAVERAEYEEGLANQINGTAVQALAQSARSINALLLHYSTDYVFDGRPIGPIRPYKETDPVSPVNAYGRSKLLGERYIQASGCDALIVRTAWLYGTQGAHFVQTILQKALRGEALSVVADQRGTPTSVRQLALLTRMLLSKAHLQRRNGDFRNLLLHATATGEASWYEFACEIVKQARALAVHKAVKQALDVCAVSMRHSQDAACKNSIPEASGPLCVYSDGGLRCARRPPYSVLSNAALEVYLDDVPQQALASARGDWKKELAYTLALMRTQSPFFSSYF